MFIKTLATLGGLAFVMSIYVVPACADKPERAITPTTKQYDSRLPPIVPGETIVTESGDRIKVWSSSGSPSTLPTATPSSGGSAIIVDGRARSLTDGSNSGAPDVRQP